MGAAGVVLTNTTIDYSLLPGAAHMGGLSGRVLKERSFEVLEAVARELFGRCLLISVGGRFKFMERMSGRLSDVLSHLYMASATIKQFIDDGQPDDDLPVVRLALADSLEVIQTQLRAVLDNFPVAAVGPLLKRLLFPFGTVSVQPDDRQLLAVVRLHGHCAKRE